MKRPTVLISLLIVGFHYQAVAQTQTIVIPPDELQTGGSQLFEGLIPNHVKFRDRISSTTAGRAFLNQPVDLSLLGSGANIIFVCDSAGNYMWVVSNGRFDSRESNGKLVSTSYPLRLGQTLDDKTAFGKYPWPQDATGAYLPGDRLVTSNGPHSDLATAFRELDSLNLLPTKSREPIVNGHVSIGKDGKAVIGYLSGMNDDGGALGDRRALNVNLRKQLHATLGVACRGRGIEKVLAAAPTTLEQVLQKQSQAYFPVENRVAPPLPKLFAELDFFPEDQREARLISHIEQSDLSGLHKLISLAKPLELKYPNAHRVFKEEIPGSIENAKLNGDMENLLEFAKLNERSEGDPTVRDALKSAIIYALTNSPSSETLNRFFSDSTILTEYPELWDVDNNVALHKLIIARAFGTPYNEYAATFLANNSALFRGPFAQLYIDALLNSIKNNPRAALEIFCADKNLVDDPRFSHLIRDLLTRRLKEQDKLAYRLLRKNAHFLQDKTIRSLFLKSFQEADEAPRSVRASATKVIGRNPELLDGPYGKEIFNAWYGQLWKDAQWSDNEAEELLNPKFYHVLETKYRPAFLKLLFRAVKNGSANPYEVFKKTTLNGAEQASFLESLAASLEKLNKNAFSYLARNLSLINEAPILAALDKASSDPAAKGKQHIIDFFKANSAALPSHLIEQLESPIEVVPPSMRRKMFDWCIDFLRAA